MVNYGFVGQLSTAGRSSFLCREQYCLTTEGGFEPCPKMSRLNSPQVQLIQIFQLYKSLLLFSKFQNQLSNSLTGFERAMGIGDIFKGVRLHRRRTDLAGVNPFTKLFQSLIE